jgi:hypothetical protein
MIVVFSSGSWSVASYCARWLFEGRIVKAWIKKYENMRGSCIAAGQGLKETHIFLNGILFAIAQHIYQ